ncbi:hypothetical protein [Lonsdalea populi]|uniref:hypothetical protein n=1 Tax=Lonsdalea populi TaxID=1172565 RepID=UPI0011BE3241|nr:hypothetical protein [Lonsdalea populi]
MEFPAFGIFGFLRVFLMSKTGGKYPLSKSIRNINKKFLRVKSNHCVVCDALRDPRKSYISTVAILRFSIFMSATENSAATLCFLVKKRCADRYGLSELR